MVVLLLAVALAAPTTAPASRPAVHADDFRNISNWSVELENGGGIDAKDGNLVIDVPAGCLVWFRPKLEAPVTVEYEARVVSAGGTNDRVSDLNCFFLATDARSPADLFATHRSGRFADYNALRCYYVGIGGNENTTTRFRRYVGDATTRPLLAEHDLRDARSLLQPNRWQTIRFVSRGNAIEFWRDDVRLFEMADPQPYTSGHFAFRTVHSHIEIRHFHVYRGSEANP